MTTFVDPDGHSWTFDERHRIGDSSGMGQVFRGAPTGGGAPVAIKRVQLQKHSVSAERRRGREVEIGDRLTLAARSGNETSHLVLPISHQFVDGDLLIVMPLADGSLQHALETTTFDTADGVDVVRQVAQGLVELAAIAVVHRDLKPANVLRYGTTWKITDFGLSRILSEGTGSYTLAGWGTDPYTAPELWLNHPASAKSDLYALGVLAFEVFSGLLPFEGPDFRHQHLQEPPPGLPATPPRIARLILRLLSKAPADRPQDARAVREALDAFAERLSPPQEALVEAALRYDRRIIDEHAAVSERAAAQEREQHLRSQANSDLDQILADAFDDIATALPDATFDSTSSTLTLSGMRIVFEASAPLRLSEHDRSPVVLTGVVRRYPAVGPLGRGHECAHLRCETTDDGRLMWFITTWTGGGARRRLDDHAVLEIVREAIESNNGSRG